MMSVIRSSRRRGVAFVALLLAVALVGAGCSQDSGTEEAATTTAAEVATTEATTMGANLRETAETFRASIE